MRTSAPFRAAQTTAAVLGLALLIAPAAVHGAGAGSGSGTPTHRVVAASAQIDPKPHCPACWDTVPVAPAG